MEKNKGKEEDEGRERERWESEGKRIVFWDRGWSRQ